MTDRCTYSFEWRRRENNRRNKVLKLKPNETKKIRRLSYVSALRVFRRIVFIITKNE